MLDSQAMVAEVSRRVERVAIDGREVAFRLVDAGLDGFEVFAARDRELVHVLVVSVDEAGEPVLSAIAEQEREGVDAVLSPPLTSFDFRCPWRRVAMGDGRITVQVGQPGRGTGLSVTVEKEERDGVMGVRIVAG